MAVERTAADKLREPGDILLDAGTNELEVLIFRLGPGWFGVNVAKVREVIKPRPLSQAPNMHRSVLGMFNIRGVVLPVVDLAGHLSMEQETTVADRLENGRVIIMEFNGIRSGYLVDNVDRIHRMSWTTVKPAPDLSFARSADEPIDLLAATTGTIDLDGCLIQMLDFESVADSILCEQRLHIEPVENPDGVDRPSKRVVLVEDSPFMRNLMRRVLVDSGYAGLEVFSNGREAWDAMSQPGGSPIDALVSDIEMPQIDGLHLTKLVKESAELRDVPVVLFSSLISEDNKKKGEQVGADVQIPKPELHEMVRLIDRAVTGGIGRTAGKLAA